MDIERFKKLSNQKIEAGRKTRTVRDGLKEYEITKQDQYEGISQLYKPIIDAEKKCQRKY